MSELSTVNSDFEASAELSTVACDVESSFKGVQCFRPKSGKSELSTVNGDFEDSAAMFETICRQVHCFRASFSQIF